MIHTEIKEINARQILDSRGDPTVECEVTLVSGEKGRASVPSGASTGKDEAMELRDGDPSRYRGRGVSNAVLNIRETIAPSLLGVPAEDQTRVDSLMLALDGSPKKTNLGANATLAVSLAVARAAAKAYGVPLYRYLGGALPRTLPVPMMNILNGGKHASNNVDIQEFMAVPIGAGSFAEAVRMGVEVYHALKEQLASLCLSTAVGDEGGFAPALPSDADALSRVLEAIEKAGYRPGNEVALALDVAASGFVREEGYCLPKRGKEYTRVEFCEYIASLCDRFPILSVEDGMGEDDRRGWKMLSEKLGGARMLVGDDLFVTDPEKIRRGLSEKLANAVLIKPNQIGTLTETFSAVTAAKRQGAKVVFSHRSGETADTFIADLAFALGADFIKCGAPARAERTEKYNRLLAIEQELFAPVYGRE